MHPMYFSYNIGQKMLPHYEKLSVLIELNKHEKLELSGLSQSDIYQLENHEKFVEKTSSGMAFWKKYFYTYTEEGKMSLKHYHDKYRLTTRDITEYLNSLDDLPDIYELESHLTKIIKGRFLGIADYVIHGCILNAMVPMSLNAFRSMKSMENAIKLVKRKYSSEKLHTYYAYGSTEGFFLLSLLADTEPKEIFDFYFKENESKSDENEPEIEENQENDEDSTSVTITVE